MTSISYKNGGDVATILLDAPNGKPPVFDGDVLGQLENCVLRASVEEPRIVLVRSTSERFFCVGANINALKEIDEKSIFPWVMEGHRILNGLEDLPMPVVAVVDGYAMGGGLELAMACDLIFAVDRAQLAQSEALLGFVPGWGATRRLANRIGWAKAKYYFYCGKMIGANEAYEIGLVDFAGDKNEVEAEVNEFSLRVVATNRNALSQFKRILNDQERSARIENAAAEAFASIGCLQDGDAKRRLSDFLAKRKSK